MCSLLLGEKDVELLAFKMIINGTSDRTYTPEMEVTRAQFVALFVRGLGLPNEALPAVFSPDQLITREQMVVILMKAVVFVHGAVKTEAIAAVQFADQDQLSDYARKAVSEAAGKGLVHD